MASSEKLSKSEGEILLLLARITLMDYFQIPVRSDDRDRLKANLGQPVFNRLAGTFVTLKINNQLRGCIGSLNAIDPLAESIRKNALNAAFHDYRFQPLTEVELNKVNIEISVLTQPNSLIYTDADDLLQKLRPEIDGVILKKGAACATFLPQVWAQLPNKEDFLGHLCQKAGLQADCWRNDHLEICNYQVQSFHEHLL